MPIVPLLLIGHPHRLCLRHGEGKFVFVIHSLLSLCSLEGRLTIARAMPMNCDEFVVSREEYVMDPFTAASLGDGRLIKSALNAGTFKVNDCNAEGWTALMYAAYLGHEPVCEMLLKNGAAADFRNPTGQTALMHAASCGQTSILRLLLKCRARLDAQDTAGRSALFYAVECMQTGCLEFLLIAGASPNLRDKAGMTPTLLACTQGNELILQTLIEKKGDPNLKNADGQDGRQLAIEFDHSRLLDVINSAGKQTTPVVYDNLEQLLVSIRSEACLAIFQQHQIDLEGFLKLSESRLNQLGIKLGGRKKMLEYIENYWKSR